MKKNDMNNNFEDNKKDSSSTQDAFKQQDSASPAFVDNKPKPKKKRKKFSLLDKILLFAAIGLILGAAVLFLWDPVMSILRDNRTNDLLKEVENGSPTVIVNRDDLAINGEEYENLYQDPNATEETMPSVDLPADVKLTAVGTIKIPKIDLYLPLWDDAGIVPLRYGAGMLAGTAMPGEEGNLVVLGHRMKKAGSLFNRLNEVAVGDEVIITTQDKAKHVYVIDEVIPKLEPTELYKYIEKDSGTGKQITLITCTPVGVGSHRILAIGHIKE